MFPRSCMTAGTAVPYRTQSFWWLHPEPCAYHVIDKCTEAGTRNELDFLAQWTGKKTGKGLAYQGRGIGKKAFSCDKGPLGLCCEVAFHWKHQALEGSMLDHGQPHYICNFRNVIKLPSCQSYEVYPTEGLEGFLFTIFHSVVGWFSFLFFFFLRETDLNYPVFSIKEIDTLTRLVMVVAAAREVIKKSNLSLFPKTPVPKLDGSQWAWK